MPGRIRAENYTNMSGIDIEKTQDVGGGNNVGWIDANDWMSYNINVVESKTYIAKYRYASERASGNIVLSDAEGNIIRNTAFTPTGGWQQWKTIESAPFELTEGATSIRVSTTTGGFNLNWLELSFANGSSISKVEADQYKLSVFPMPAINDEVNISLEGYSGTLQVVIYNLNGERLYYKNFNHFSNTSKIEDVNLESGFYVLSVVTSNKTYKEKLVVE